MDQTQHPTVVRTLKWDGAKMSREILLNCEWLVTNGLGGYASGSVSGAVARRYHGLLIAALPAPLGRVVMLNHLAEYLRMPDGTCVQIGGDEPGDATSAPHDRHFVSEFRIEDGLPAWRFEVNGIVVEKRLV